VASGCVLSGLDRSVKICAPATGTMVSSPVRIQATLSDSGTVQAAQIYADGALKFSTGFTHLVDRLLAITSGTHRITVKAWDAAGQFSQTLNVNVQ
jgi:Bacterial Ig domain